MGGEKHPKLGMVCKDVIQKALLHPSEAAKAATKVEELCVSSLVAVLLHRVVPHDVHLLGVETTDSAFIADVEMVHLNVNSQGVLVRGSESTDSAGPPLIFVSFNFHFPWKLNFGLFDDLDIVINGIKEEVGELRMDKEDVVAVLLDLPPEPADAALELEQVQLLHLIVLKLHVFQRIIFVVRSVIAKAAVIAEAEMIIIHVFLQPLVRLLIGSTESAGEPWLNWLRFYFQLHIFIFSWFRDLALNFRLFLKIDFIFFNRRDFFFYFWFSLDLLLPFAIL